MVYVFLVAAIVMAQKMQVEKSRPTIAPLVAHLVAFPHEDVFFHQHSSCRLWKQVFGLMIFTLYHIPNVCVTEIIDSFWQNLILHLQVPSYVLYMAPNFSDLRSTSRSRY